ncbi:hypothetical protein T03_7623 [Trichinella britovi]|uniref:Uncharacterized protein n=1 Tax=Trichinella britovi TaxID=45882 RepID=A0A0V1CMK9_TRIBR|nr:hypothetical protein T03_7623 [Trichinella britovi]
MKYILKTQQQQQQQLTLFDDSCQLAAVLQNSKKRKICVQYEIEKLQFQPITKRQFCKHQRNELYS